jgi:signal recognition particle receptor subunit beta
LTGADGIVFVADAQPDRLAANRASLDELARNLLGQGKRLETVPLVMQYNKRDQPTAMTASELDQQLNPARAPTVDAVAITGDGVIETLRTICKLVTRAL